MKLVYLAGPIDGVDRSLASKWRTEAKAMFAERNVATYDPDGAFHGVGLNDGIISDSVPVDQINRFALVHSTHVMAYLPRGARAYGTAREIEYAKCTGQAVVVVVPDGYRCVAFCDLYVVETIREAVEWVTAQGAI